MMSKCLQGTRTTRLNPLYHRLIEKSMSLRFSILYLHHHGPDGRTAVDVTAAVSLLSLCLLSFRLCFEFELSLAMLPRFFGVLDKKTDNLPKKSARPCS